MRSTRPSDSAPQLDRPFNSAPRGTPVNGAGRTKWKYTEKAKEFHAAHSHAPYMMMWISVVEAEMRDADLPKQNRVLAAIRRYSWGNLSSYAVDRMAPVDPGDPEPRALTQEDLARILNLAPSLSGRRKSESWACPD